jgi:hypothetical protein
MYSMHFNRNASFASSDFRGVADFRFSKFNKSTNFFRCKFKDNAYFRLSWFNETLDFAESELRNVNFEGASINKLNLYGCEYDKMYIRWHNITNFIYDDVAYLSLLKNFRELGYIEDYDSCYFQYRKEHRGQPWPLVGGVDKPIRRIFDFFLEWSYGYGTRPLNALYFSLAFIIIFGIFWRAIGVGGPNDSTEEESKVWEKPTDILDIFGFSATVFLSGTRLFIDPPDIPRIKGLPRSIIKKAFILERILGALFSILFFLAISGTVVR